MKLSEILGIIPAGVLVNVSIYNSVCTLVEGRRMTIEKVGGIQDAEVLRLRPHGKSMRIEISDGDYKRKLKHLGYYMD